MAETRGPGKPTRRWEPSRHKLTLVYALGILMNRRGLMELIVLNVGLDLRILSPTLFAMLVLMAVITTLMTTPVLQALTSRATKADMRVAAHGVVQ